MRRFLLGFIVLIVAAVGQSFPQAATAAGGARFGCG
jgi:hypothetical protein